MAIQYSRQTSDRAPRGYSSSTEERAEVFDFDRPYAPGLGLRYTSGMYVLGMEYQPDYNALLKPHRQVHKCRRCGAATARETKTGLCGDCMMQKRKESAKFNDRRRG